MKSKLICIILSAILTVANLALIAFADTDSLMTLEELREENGAITVEAYNIGQGFLVEPTLYRKETGRIKGIRWLSVGWAKKSLDTNRKTLPH